jgi:hypothetical protein
MSDRDEFPIATKRALQGRVGSLCSNPTCQKLTSGPSHHADKVSLIGVAAHISAATTGGPRFDSSLSSDQRKDSYNGIWLCQNCARLIDVDEITYSTDVLFDWKNRAEQHARTQLETTKGAAPSLYEATTVEEDQMQCPHCGTLVSHGLHVCVGCQAQIYYCETPIERELWLKGGGATGFGCGLLLLATVKSIAVSLGINADSVGGAGLTPLYIVAITTILGIFCGFTGLRWYVSGRQPMFVRYAQR